MLINSVLHTNVNAHKIYTHTHPISNSHRNIYLVNTSQLSYIQHTRYIFIQIKSNKKLFYTYSRNKNNRNAFNQILQSVTKHLNHKLKQTINNTKTTNTSKSNYKTT